MQQVGQQIDNASDAVLQAADDWNLGRVERTLTRTLVARYPEIIDQIDDEFPIGAAASDAYVN